MSAFIDGVRNQHQCSWQRWGQLAAAFTIGIFDASAALAIDNHPPKVLPHQGPGPTCQWPALKGDLMTPPAFVLAFDKDFNVQGFYRPGAGAGKAPPQVPEVMILEKEGSATTYCYTIDGKRECIED